MSTLTLGAEKNGIFNVCVCTFVQFNQPGYFQKKKHRVAQSILSFPYILPCNFQYIPIHNSVLDISSVVCVCFMLIFTFSPSLRSQSYFIISLCVRRFFQHILTNFIFFFHFVHFFTFIRSFQFFSFYLHALIVFFLLLLYFSASTTHRSSN